MHVSFQNFVIRKCIGPDGVCLDVICREVVLTGPIREYEDTNQSTFLGGLDEHHAGGEGVGYYIRINVEPAANRVDYCLENMTKCGF